MSNLVKLKLVEISQIHKHFNVKDENKKVFMDNFLCV